jgi:hypothetical protein
MPDLKISQLTDLAQGSVDASDKLPIVDSSASETKKIGAVALVGAGVKLLPTGAIDWSKIDSTSFAVPASSVGAAQITANSVGTAAIVDGAVTDAKIAGPIAVGKLGNQAARLVLAGPVAGGNAAPTFRAIAATDLPIGSTTAVGALSVGPASGLAVDAAGSISLSVTTTAGTSPVVTYDAQGRVTSGRALQSVDLPLATSTAIGGVKPGDGLSVASDGTIGFSHSITAGTGTKITYDQHGLVTGSASLAATDIPSLDAAKITSGTFGTALLANGSVTQNKLADYALSYIQEATPPVAVGAHPIGELWFQESSARLSMWNGNSWMAVGQGALSGQNLRFCGTFDATNGHVKALTTFGTTDGFILGSAIPAASNTLTGAYLVCDTAGNATGVATGVSFDPGDWIVCLGQARGWERIDTLNGSSGGGGSSTLDHLTDVAVTTPATGDILVFSGTSWTNRQANVDPGTYS